VDAIDNILVNGSDEDAVGPKKPCSLIRVPSVQVSGGKVAAGMVCKRGTSNLPPLNWRLVRV